MTAQKMHVLGKGIAGLMLATVALVGVPQVAEAHGGNCSSTRQKDSGFIDKFRVRASCSSLQANSKAMGWLDRTGDPDVDTGWFTALNTYRYSDYVSCLLTCNNTYTKTGPV